MEVNKVIDAYVKFYKDKPTNQEGCPLTHELIQEHQQEINSNGYGYVNLAACLCKEGSAALTDDGKAYYNFLKSNDVYKLADKIGLSEGEILNISIDTENGEPNQKWHLLVSYLGMAWFLDQKTIRLSSVSCPELWMWMFETSGLFNVNRLREICDRAILYRTKKIKRNEWIKYIEDERKELNKVVMRLENND